MWNMTKPEEGPIENGTKEAAATASSIQQPGAKRRKAWHRYWSIAVCNRMAYELIA